MRRLVHDHERKPECDAIKKPFAWLERKYLPSALSLALLTGTVTATALLPSVAYAQQIVIQNTRVETERLNDTIANLERNSVQYQCGEINDTEGRTPFSYVNSITMPGELGASVGFYRNSVAKALNITWPRQRGGNPNAEDAYTWDVRLDTFADFIKKATNQDLTRVKIIVMRGSAQDTNAPRINVYVIPVDAQGRMFARYGDGYLAYGATLHLNANNGQGAVAGAIVDMLEPGVQEPIARR